MKQEIRNQIKNAVEYLKRTHDNATYHWHLFYDDNENDWSFVLGWSDGFEEDETNQYLDGSYGICAKIAYQPYNSLMCEYDIDWIMPYNEETNEVDDTELSLINGITDEDITYLLGIAKGYGNF